LGAVRAEGGVDVVPTACADAGERQVLRMFALDEEVGVTVLFDGEEDEVVIAAVADDSGCACGLGDVRDARGWGGLDQLGAAEKHKAGCDE